ncbi:MULTISPECIES: hypothetical protein [Hoeflea]|jgi:hypothetical protein|uniref:DUF680 domain-containing protein n=1 Tax=Hoeflea alexandrii TaxID=288436 RepID=A0ABT1CX12_9HYPH|nr:MULTISPECIES: hypothetical protein [Hoeflea]MCO6410742.1 hypothetical protein [Hoeflea alexandrii]MCY0152141.1 hypothetical protein [Hoeflea alexandrii]VVT25249.1 conserved exported hypothetical protein [Hoeflea sp. EC-HK425]
MNKIIIALGLTLAASTGAFAQSPNDWVELNAPVHGPAAMEHAAKSDMGGVDYTATASTVRTPSTDNPEQNGYTALQFNR